MAKYLQFFRNSNPTLTDAKYLHGVPNLNKNFIVRFSPDKNGIQFKDAKSDANKFYLNKNDIIKITVEDQTTISSRVGFKRLLLVGIFAFAWKKRSQIPLSFLIFDYRDEFGESQEMFIQSEKKTGYQDFTNIKYNLQKYWLEAETDPDFDKRLIQFQKSELSDSQKRNRLMIVLFAIIIIIAIINRLNS